MRKPTVPAPASGFVPVDPRDLGSGPLVLACNPADLDLMVDRITNAQAANTLSFDGWFIRGVERVEDVVEDDDLPPGLVEFRRYVR